LVAKWYDYQVTFTGSEEEIEPILTDAGNIILPILASKA
jgi:hypothetical protein